MTTKSLLAPVRNTHVFLYERSDGVYAAPPSALFSLGGENENWSLVFGVCARQHATPQLQKSANPV
jgi:hypothetical protein